jgi:hypothetical protein
MGTNGFREEELVSRRVKVGNEWQTRTFPVVGGRLRLLHETNDHLGIQTEIIKLEPDFVVVQAAAETTKGKFNGIGTASTQRDARLADSLVELAETRAVARALRFAGFGLEYCGAEEVSHVLETEEPAQRGKDQQAEKVFDREPGNNGSGKLAQSCANNETGANQGQAAAGGNGSKPQRCGIGQATQAQCRALFALTKRANYTAEDIDGMLSSMGAATFQDLTRESASQLIGSLQAEVAA